MNGLPCSAGHLHGGRSVIVACNWVSQADIFGFGKGSVQSGHWFGQVLAPVLLEVLHCGYQFRQHIGGVDNVGEVVWCSGTCGKDEIRRLSRPRLTCCGRRELRPGQPGDLI